MYMQKTPSTDDEIFHALFETSPPLFLDSLPSYHGTKILKIIINKNLSVLLCTVNLEEGGVPKISTPQLCVGHALISGTTCS
jgi:hypothetical protein